MHRTLAQALVDNFLGNAASWYKLTIIIFLIANPIVLAVAGPFIAGWLLVGEFIFCLAMALKCYPLQPGGLLAMQAVILNLTSPGTVFHEAENNFEVIMLLIFMVAGIFFLKELLLYIFTKIMIRVKSKVLLSLMFSFAAAVLSAFLDALTVTAVIIAVAAGLFGIYHKVTSGKGFDDDHDHADDSGIGTETRTDLEQFRAFLRNLMMHGAVGTALGGVCTLVGEPQNLLIGEVVGWEFIEFFVRVAPVSMPVLVVGLLTCVAVEKFKILSYGTEMPTAARRILEEYDRLEDEKRTPQQKAALIVQALVALFLVVALALHWAEVGLIGLAVIVLATTFTGIIEEHRLGHAFEEALPFTALLVVFFAIVGVIHDQHLFLPVINFVFSLDQEMQVPVFFMANGVLSAISDNVFVATVYINEVYAAFEAGNISRQHFEELTVAINTGTNIPSVATPNGQAAFLFLLTSALAPVIRLGYGRMVLLALPYTITMTIAGLLATIYLL
ncbi:MAG: sodium/proton antiporter NhaB [Xanthomonadales bacterium]|nr:sodium/proton antiporter NhaB [Gammaproteobacteria bacterium]MBT8051316.1 sodium/proton antiporter NhaB [Gammaproteobacteria bacterium]MBT8057331.1 sodium/proton antiporter NhaB [Gammaproteobacteria bacterium]NNJ77782.1 sodium/proton antiporter NhaB [Xanthomonadales bacterium]NNL04679.1 sodium/proton antiporter NhaB [Xanthomonadales bacterium]